MSRLLPRLHRRLYTTGGSSSSGSSASTPPPQDAKAVAAQFLAAHSSIPPKVRTQTLDHNQLHLLSRTLSRPPPPLPQSAPPTTTTAKGGSRGGNGAVIPPCHHLVYFTPSQPTENLGPDGTDTTYNPGPPFTRRMWAGGEVVWPRKKEANGGQQEQQQPNLLRVGQEVTETTKVCSAEAKRTRSGEEMIVVGVEKTFENEDGVAVVDRRNWVFRPTLHDALSGSSLASTIPSPHTLPYLSHTSSSSSPTPSSSSAQSSSSSSSSSIPSPSPPPLPPIPRAVPFPPGAYTRDVTASPTTLFRFSALTFNAHKIHYDGEWCRLVEGHRRPVVHGPLNLLLMLDFWRDVVGGSAAAAATAATAGGGGGGGSSGGHGQGNRESEMETGYSGELVPARIVYRATGSFYAGEPYRIVMDEEWDGVCEVRIVDGYGNVGMVGRIERYR